MERRLFKKKAFTYSLSSFKNIYRMLNKIATHFSLIFDDNFWNQRKLYLFLFNYILDQWKSKKVGHLVVEEQMARCLSPWLRAQMATRMSTTCVMCLTFIGFFFPFSTPSTKFSSIPEDITCATLSQHINSTIHLPTSCYIYFLSLFYFIKLTINHVFNITYISAKEEKKKAYSRDRLCNLYRN